ncbi:MAG: prephenate dehydrogenase/arogenate dehydrogenase family protein [Gemmatimonadetes bacterium]|nr:prephenate dehydrogenase/arogenate dehydrogenase family protein [Gemmatimonadota bacterium]
MTPPRAVAILGLGLMGGSLARDLAASGIQVQGYDADDRSCRQALAAGVLAEVLDDELTGLRAADLVVLATPVDRTGAMLARLAPRLKDGCLVTDLGSTKRTILAQASEAGLGGRFVGAHPLAGDHRSGWEAARAGLYREATVFLCPDERASAGTVSAVRSFWESVGGRCTIIDAGAHDTLMAWVSHLPQVASSAVAAALAGAGHDPATLGRGGRDVTRLAASSPEMWSAICRTNGPAIADAVGALSRELAGAEAALRAGDDAALRRFFAAGRDWLDAR